MQFNKQWKEFLMEERYPDLLLEARVKDVKAKYPALEKLNWINWGRRQLESTLGVKGVSKYLMFFARELFKNFDEEFEEYLEFGDSLELNQNDVLRVAEEIMDVIQDFQQNQQRMDEKDIYKYNVAQLQHKLDNLGLSKRAKMAALKDKEAAEEGSTMVYNDHGIMAIRPETMQASCYYGHNPRLTTWCISTKSARNYFDQYTKDEGKAFVIVRFFGIPEGSDNHIIALQFDFEGDLEMFWDAPNNSQDPDDLFGVITEHFDGLKDSALANLPPEEAGDFIAKVEDDLLSKSKLAIQDDPPPNPIEAAEKACEEIQQEAERDLTHVSVYYEVQEDYGESEPYVYYSARIDIDMDISGEAYTNAPNPLADIDYQEVRDLESELETRLSDVGIYGIEEIDMTTDPRDETSFQVSLTLYTGDEQPSVEGFREFVNFTCAQFENQVNDIQQVVNSVLMEKEYYVPAGMQIPLPGIEEDIRKYFNNNHLTKQGFYDSIEKDIIKEEKGRSRQRGIYKFYCMLSYGLTISENKSRGLDDILADLRALPNVTIVTVVVKNQKIAEGRYIAGLSIKFIPSVPGQFSSPEDVKTRILRDIKRLNNVQTLFKVSAGLERLE
tara:strand:+ start:3511 stop:5343 length:1833 start_codon:yes stop_codon:yes gene_type:complete